MVGARGGAGRHCAAAPAGVRCLATEVGHVPRHQVSKIEGDGEMLTGLWKKGEERAQGVQRRGPAAEGNRARVRGRGRGAPGSWTPQVDAGCSCGGSGGVSVARDAAAARN